MSEPNSRAKDGVSAGAQPDRASRVVGFLTPAHERMRRACKALDDDRLDDVQPNIDAVSDEDDPTGAWRAWLTGRLLARRLQPTAALEHLDRCIAACEAGEKAPGGDAAFARLRAAALEEIGVLRRRREELPAARHAHEEAYRIRRDHGSPEERWESAQSVGVTLSLLKEWDDAERWYRTALDCAAQLPASADPHVAPIAASSDRDAGLITPASDRDAAPVTGSCDHYAARTLTALAELESQRGRTDQAVDFARQALASFARHDPGSLDTARAEATLARLLVAQAESCLGTDATRLARCLDEALERADAAEESLRAFDANTDARACRELIDFANRLRDEL